MPHCTSTWVPVCCAIGLVPARLAPSLDAFVRTALDGGPAGRLTITAVPDEPGPLGAIGAITGLTAAAALPNLSATHVD